MQTYTHYKESSIDWIGQIPEHWLLIPNKFIFRLKKNQVGKRSSEYDLLSLTLRGIIKRDMENPEGKFPAEFDTYQEVKVNDFVFCLFDVEETPRTVGLSTYDGMITGAYTVMEPIGENFAPYLYYYYLNADDKKQLKFLYRGLRNTIPKDSFFSLKTALPPINEQQAIANFLDEKTAKIDALVQTKEQQIEKLKELRQAKIHQAVTKGLDANAPTKDSGVEWIGEIPEHWEIGRFTQNLNFQEGPGIMALDFKEKGIPLIRISGVKTDIVTLDGCNYLDPNKVNQKWLHFKTNVGDLVISGSASIDLISEIKDETQGSILYTGLIRLFNFSNNLNKIFLKFFIKSEIFKIQIELLKTGSTISHFGPSHLQKIKIVLPPIKEQEAIVTYLDEVTGKIDQAIAQKQEQITKLKEYKQSLINDVVTGKVKVC